MAETDVVEELENQTQQEKTEVQLQEAATLLGTAIKSPKPVPKTIWEYTVQPPIIGTVAGALAIANPALAVAVLPALGVGAKIGKRIKDIQEDLKWKVAPYIAPAQVIEYKYKMAARKALWAIPKALLFRNFTLDTPIGRYKYKDFWPTAIIGARISRVLGGWSGGRVDSVFKKAADNLKPYYWNRKEGLKRNEKRRGLWGVLVGLIIVDILGTAVGRVLKNTAVKVLKATNTGNKILKVLGGEKVQVGGRVFGSGAGAAFSLNTVAGGAIGFVASGGNPLVAAVGAFGGAGVQFYKNLAADAALRNKYLEVKIGEFAVPGGPEVPEIKVLGPPSRAGRIGANLYKPAAFVSEFNQLKSLKAGFAARFPLKGFALGFALSGGNPVVGLVFAGYQLGWSIRGYLPKYALFKYSGGRFASFAEFTKHGPRWAKALRGGRVVGGAGVGGAVGYLVSGLNPVGTLMGAAIGAPVYFTLTKSFYIFQTRYWSKIAERLGIAGRKFPYWKGVGVGFGIAAILAGLGVPPALALAIGLTAGVGGQFLFRKFAARFLGKFAAKTVVKYGVTRLPLRAVPIVGWALLGMDIIRYLFPYLADLLDKFVIQKLEAFMAKGWWAKLLAGPAWFLAKSLYWFLKGIGWLIDKVLWPLDKLLDLGFQYVVAPILGPLFSGLFRILGFLLTGLAHIPVIGGIFGAIKDFFSNLFGGARDLAKGLVGVLTGLVGAVISLLTGGDIAEAAFIGAIGLILAGVIIASAAPEPAVGPNPFVNLTKTAEAPDLNLGPEQSIHIGNLDNLPKDVIFNVTITAKTNLRNLRCFDELTLTKTDGTTETNPSELGPPPAPPIFTLCHESNFQMSAGETLSQSFRVTIPDQEKFRNAILTNRITLQGEAEVTIECGTNFSFAQSTTALPLIYCGAANFFGVPAGVLAGISNIEGSQVFSYSNQEVTAYSAPGAKDPYQSPVGDPDAQQQIGCTVSSSGAAGPMQFLYGPAQPLVDNPVDPTATNEEDLTWGQYRNAVNEATGEDRTPQVCNIKDSIYAAAKKNRADCGPQCPHSNDWTQNQVYTVAESYHGDCSEPLFDIDGDGIDDTYCEAVWKFYDAHKVD